ncbi:ABC transporter ATP-binding protein/permease [Corynebacterium uropygiale]|uniref:ABC transporter ATP-binding protein/permease n=1 Tax=Corynebacterium uropygiale TaxID=1775911 RepID=A0A9X1QS21_9CORY|nr:ABC transporter ATP-binding protein [Corynebacterium uropygiale]MCF4007352.1 ABC transporter ATP-binding protein/permease [Corynebacterium uropygiale]
MMTFIRTYEALFTRPTRLRSLLGWYTLSAVLQGVAYILFIPVLRSLFAGEGVALWFLLMLLVAIGALVLFTLTIRSSYMLYLDDLLDLTEAIGDRTVQLPLGWFDDRSTSRINQAVLADMDMLGRVPPIIAPNIINATVIPLIITITMFFFDWRMGLALAIAIPILVILVRWLGRVSRVAAARETDALEAVGARVLEFASLQSVLRAGGGSRGTDTVLASIEEAATENQASLDHRGRPINLSFIVTHAALVLALVLGVHAALGGELEWPIFLALAMFCLLLAQPLALLPPHISGMSDAQRSVDRVGSILHAPVLPEPATPAEPEGYDIALHDVSFGYDDAHPVLQHLNLEFPQNSVTALVGPSGCGKSTILSLIARFYDVDGGAITVGGRDIREIGTARLMRDTAMVFQDVYLFEGSIAENVRLGRPEATQEELEAAARRARLDEVIKRLPEGWDTPVGEGGNQLSGGEKQRVAIARAFLKDSPILLLDEVTSSLDGANEAAVSSAIRELAEGRTTIMIAHRLSTVTHATSIVVFSETGRIEDRGTHEELSARSGTYSQFIAEQRAGANWKLA